VKAFALKFPERLELGEVPAVLKAVEICVDRRVRAKGEGQDVGARRPRGASLGQKFLFVKDAHGQALVRATQVSRECGK
jgi:hypothetical protein